LVFFLFISSYTYTISTPNFLIHFKLILKKKKKKKKTFIKKKNLLSKKRKKVMDFYMDSDVSLSMPAPEHPKMEETNFAKEFECCGMRLGSLHELMAHYDQCHVTINSQPHQSDHEVYLEPTEQALQQQHHHHHYHQQEQDHHHDQPHQHQEQERNQEKHHPQTKEMEQQKQQVKEHEPTPKKKQQKQPKMDSKDAYYQYNQYNQSAMYAQPLPQRPFTPLGYQSPMMEPHFNMMTPPPSRPASSPLMSQHHIHQSMHPASYMSVLRQSNAYPSPSMSPAMSPAMTPLMSSPALSSTGSIASNLSWSLDSGFPMGTPGSSSHNKYKCTKAGCTKVYKNSNGLKYHMKHGNCETDFSSPDLEIDATMEIDPDMKITKRPYWCKVFGCGRKYKNLNGLKYHAAHAHPEFDSKTLCKGSRVALSGF